VAGFLVSILGVWGLGVLVATRFVSCVVVLGLLLHPS